MFDVRAAFAALRRKPSPRTAFERGADLLDRGRHEAAAAAFDAAVNEARDACERASAHNKRGVALIALGRRSEALEAFCEALAGDERSAAALTNVGNLLLEDGCAADAVDYYEAAIRADENYCLAYGNLAVAFKTLGKRAEAVRSMRLAARLEARRRAGRS